MDEMPKRIWANVPHDEFDSDVTWFPTEQTRTVEYVRADIVAGLVAALEAVRAHIRADAILMATAYGKPDWKKLAPQTAVLVSNCDAALAKAKEHEQ